MRRISVASGAILGRRSWPLLTFRRLLVEQVFHRLQALRESGNGPFENVDTFDVGQLLLAFIREVPRATGPLLGRELQLGVVDVPHGIHRLAAGSVEDEVAPAN